MGALSKEVVMEILADYDFNNAGEVPAFLKDVFQDVLQEILKQRWI